MATVDRATRFHPVGHAHEARPQRIRHALAPLASRARHSLQGAIGRDSMGLGLADYERLLVAGAVFVEAPCTAVARRRAGDPADFAERAASTLVEGREAGHLLRFPPGPVDLADYERPAVEGAVCVEAA